MKRPGTSQRNSSTHLGGIAGFDLSHADAPKVPPRPSQRLSPSRHGHDPVPYFPGILAVSITPFDRDGNIRHSVLRAHIKSMIDDGVHGIIFGGSTGEMAAMDEAQWLEGVKASVEAAAGRVPVIAGAAACSTAATVRRCLAAAAAGCTGVMVVPPYYGSFTQPELIAHYGTICDALAAARSDTKLIIYNNPGVCHTSVEPHTVAALVSSHPNEVAGIKESSGQIELAEEYAKLMAHHEAFKRAPRFQLMCGCDTLAFDMFKMRTEDGKAVVTAWIAPPANVMPRLLVELWDTTRPTTEGGNTERAAVVAEALEPLLELFEGSGQYIALSKYGASKERKVDAGTPLPPISNVSEELAARFDRIMGRLRRV